MIRKAVIPAAGWGTRFLPATKSIPKEMVPIVDRPVIQYVVEEAIAAGIDDILLVISGGKRAIEEHFAPNPLLEQLLEAKEKEVALAELRAVSGRAKIHYVWQHEQRGLGHAVLCAKEHVGDEPFALLLGDTITQAPRPATQQLIELYQRYEHSVVALEAVPMEKVSRYGVIQGKEIEAGIWQAEDFIEKPPQDAAPSNLAFAARYLFTPRIFSYLEQTPVGLNNEIQLTDAMRLMLKDEAIYGLQYEGKRHDVGNPLGFLKTNLSFALQDPQYRDPLLQWLREQI